MTPTSRRIALAPADGWITLGLVVLLCLSLAWSLDDARLVLGRDGLTDFLVWTAIGGVLAGFIGPVVGWGRWTTHLVGATFAALLTPIIVGSVILPAEEGGLAAWFIATSDAVAGAIDDLIVRDRLTTAQTGHHLLLLGGVVWGSSQFASYAVFGHRRPLNAVLLVGLLLVGNMSLTTQDQLLYLVLYSLAGLFLLIRLHTLEEQAEWLRRRIGDPGPLASSYLRGGTVFIAIAVVGSLLLTNIASSAPLAGVWTDAGNRFVDWSRSIGRFLPQSGTGVALGPSFGSTATITGSWFTNDQVALTIEFPTGQIDLAPRWRAVTYDTLVLDGYTREPDAPTFERGPGERLLEGTADEVIEDGRRVVNYRVTPATGDLIYAPQTPVSIDVSTRVEVLGDEAWFASIERTSGSGTYTVVSWVPITGDTEEAALTKNKLRAAGTDYPAGLLERYAERPIEGIIGPAAREVLDEIVALGADNPYDLAADIEAFLKDSTNFQYSDDIVEDGIDCGQLSRVECFAEFRRGFCRYYAAMMTAFLREEGVPARIAEGFLPGERDLATRTETVRNSGAHSWVEVYFPTYGWVEFDPTGGGVGQEGGGDLPDGIDRESAPPRASSSAPAPTRPAESNILDNEPPGTGGGGTTDRGVGPGPLIAVALLLFVVVGTLAAVAWRRGPRGPVTPDGAYGMVTGLASRLGFAPRPNQTVFEYAGSLAELLPAARPELETVAEAKVEVAYGGRSLGADRLAGLKEAQRRLRTALLRLALRRDRFRRRRP
jgi:transglutaminase-like putative cysteine protease